jgi:hypothetical protein
MKIAPSGPSLIIPFNPTPIAMLNQLPEYRDRRRINVIEFQGSNTKLQKKLKFRPFELRFEMLVVRA